VIPVIGCDARLRISCFIRLRAKDLVETKPMTGDADSFRRGRVPAWGASPPSPPPPYPPRYWDRQAATFDDQSDHGLLDPLAKETWRRLLLAHLPAAPAAVADIGCGTGSLTVLLAAEGYAVTGLDFSPAMIRAARAKARKAEIRCRFVLSDAAAPTLPARSFDVVLARHVLWAMPVPDEALAAWLQLLLPGGVLVLVEGHWSAGGGLTAAEAGRIVLRHRGDATIITLDDPALWGRPITDERYLLVSRR
jgi:SAM-dependent methyltransferase